VRHREREGCQIERAYIQKRWREMHDGAAGASDNTSSSWTRGSRECCVRSYAYRVIDSSCTVPSAFCCPLPRWSRFYSRSQFLPAHTHPSRARSTHQHRLRYFLPFPSPCPIFFTWSRPCRSCSTCSSGRKGSSSRKSMSKSRRGDKGWERDRSMKCAGTPRRKF